MGTRRSPLSSSPSLSASLHLSLLTLQQSIGMQLIPRWLQTSVCRCEMRWVGNTFWQSRRRAARERLLGSACPSPMRDESRGKWLWHVACLVGSSVTVCYREAEHTHTQTHRSAVNNLSPLQWKLLALLCRPDFLEAVKRHITQKEKKKKTHCSEEAAVLCGGWRAPHYPDLSIWSGHCVHAVLGLPPLNAWHIHFVLETRWRIISRQLPINCPSERSSVVWLIWPSVIRPSQNTLDVFFR